WIVGGMRGGDRAGAVVASVEGNMEPHVGLRERSPVGRQRAVDAVLFVVRGKNDREGHVGGGLPREAGAQCVPGTARTGPVVVRVGGGGKNGSEGHVGGGLRRGAGAQSVPGTARTGPVVVRVSRRSGGFDGVARRYGSSSSSRD